MSTILNTMKRNQLNVLVLLLATSLMSCTTVAEEPEVPRTIEVTGSAEMAVQPDEIVLSIVLRTASHKDKKKDFLKILSDHGVTEDKIAFESSNNQYWWWYYSSYHDNSVQRYSVTIDSTVNAMSLMEALKQPWVEQIRITERSNSNIQEYRKQVKIEAIKAAKEKASYMLAALDEEIGAVVTITELDGDVNNNNPYYYWNQNQNSITSNAVLYSDQSAQSTVGGVAMQTLRYQVKIIFNIKEKS